MPIRNCIEADILKKLGGSDLQCSGTQIEILNDIVIIMGGTPTRPHNRNALLRDILALS
jgi:hypothetical protein